MNQFEKAIKAYLDDRASQDEQFAQSYKKENKSIEECCRFIIGEARKRKDGNTAIMSDAETYGLAVHYYDEDSIVVTEKGTGSSVAREVVEYTPTEEDKENAKKAALRRLEEEAFKELHAPKKRKQEPEKSIQPTLFDLL